jgi:ubiquinone/menaquinone biosynthesis C-methylase UbiE
MEPVPSEAVPIRQAFDRLAAVYDETRGPLDIATAEGLVTALRGEGIQSLLEVGTGTGRIARPLLDRGLAVTGLDFSRAMLRRARDRGVERVLLGTVYRQPFRDRSFDGVLFVHVVHLLDDPAAALRESLRVSRGPVCALVDAEGGSEGGLVESSPDSPRKWLATYLREAGVQLPPRGFSSPGEKERALLKRLPPDAQRPVSDRTVTEPAEREISALEKRGFRNLLNVPDEPLARAIARLRERFGDRKLTRRHLQALAVWRSPPEPRPVEVVPASPE